MKTKILFATMALFGMITLFTSCSEDLGNPGNDAALIEKSGELASGTCTCTTCDFTGTLTDKEKTDLLWMSEEEKLARDVYTYFYAKYKILVFKNISASETAHMSAILYLINGYKLTDPAPAEAGKFTNPDIQALYATMIAKGDVSLAEAYKAGIDIEIRDIADLTKSLGETDKTNIIRTYTNIQNASQIHLKSFTLNLKRLGIIYP